ncbi:MAG: hypothetical protein NT051_06845, partial [Candidatus Micrarchaeota archaeon]|nr:hypothetical protein [Candidatus Micrarchaeota archaeon]
ISLVVAATVTLAMLERLFVALAKTAKYKSAELWARRFFTLMIVLLALAQISIPSVYGEQYSTISIVPSAYPMLILYKSFDSRYQDNPEAAMPRLAAACEALRTRGSYDSDICNAGYNKSFADSINSQYNYKVCIVSQLSLDELIPGTSEAAQQHANEARAGASYRCNRLSDYWVETMEWISRNLPQDARVNSWWDYGHWTNYFGDRKTVLRNEHASTAMIGRVAHDFIIGSNQDLIDSMNYFDSQYVMLDVEIIGGDTFGAKYGALNYLGCSYEGETSSLQQPGTSKCEFDHSPERIIVPKTQTQANACVISESQSRTGVFAYAVGQNGVDQNNPAYCVGEASLADGQKLTGTYYLDRKDANGDLVLSKGLLRAVETQQDYVVAELVYNEQKVWQGQNGTLVSGIEDAKSKFYQSNLYRGFYLENLPGYDLVFKSKGGEVKIFKMKDSLFKGNKEGWVDPVASKKQG